MSLADRLSQHTTKTPAPCVVGQLLVSDRMTDADKATLEAALTNERITTIAIIRALADEGINVARTSLVRHRLNECACRGLS